MSLGPGNKHWGPGVTLAKISNLYGKCRNSVKQFGISYAEFTGQLGRRFNREGLASQNPEYLILNTVVSDFSRSEEVTSQMYVNMKLLLL